MIRTEYRDSTFAFPFVAYTPENTEKKLPLILQLHGAGERGSGQDDLKLVDVHGFSKLLDEKRLSLHRGNASMSCRQLLGRTG